MLLALLAMISMHVVYLGPSHMEKFATEDLVQEKFMETVTARPFYPSVKKQLGRVILSSINLCSVSDKKSCIGSSGGETETHPLKVNPIKLPSLDVGLYRCNDLQRIVPLISNPYG